MIDIKEILEDYWKNFRYKLRSIFVWPLQSLFLGYNDRELWSLDYKLMRWILPKLVAFRKYTHGYPPEFIDWNEHCGMTKEKYDELYAKGEYIGGGFDAWLQTVDEMIFSFVFAVYESEDKPTRLEKKLIKKMILEPYGNVQDYIIEHGEMKFTPTDETEKYFTLAFKGMVIDEEKKAKMYELRKRAWKGSELFGKYWRNLWI